MPRLVSALVMAALAAGCLWAGGVWFMALIALSSGVMIWELGRMCDADRGNALIGTGIAAAAVMAIVAYAPAFYIAPLLLGFVIATTLKFRQNQMIYAGYGALIMLAGYGFIKLRFDLEPVWMLWLILIVVASDVAGYLAGRLLGGPKFWPRLSPKKTWSGTIAGWLGAGIVGVFFVQSFSFVLISMLVAFAAQMGDIAESAIKRHAGIKDSSNLIPGHGGFMDRFDGMLGAMLLVLLLVLFTDFPPMG